MRKGSSKYIGKKYGTLTVLEVRRNYCTVRCDCGNEYERQVAHLHKAKHPTCPDCRDVVDGGNEAHPLYKTWSAMKSRCNNSNNNLYHYYGARGIKVCASWSDSFKTFVSDMGDRPDGYTLDRIDNDAGYEPANCRWATMMEQCNNRRSNVNITYRGKTMTQNQWCRELGIPRRTHGTRVQKGMTNEEAFDYHFKNDARKKVYVTYRGQTRTVAEWCRELGVSRSGHNSRVVRGMTHEQSFDYHLK